MHLNQIARLFVFFVGSLAVTSDAWAYKRDSRVPLTGTRGYFAASGSARYLVFHNVPKETDREELIVEVNNVPMPVGTVLVAYVNDEPIGQITLDKRQSGSLKLTSAFRKVIPPVDFGTSVMLKTIEGQLVIW